MPIGPVAAWLEEGEDESVYPLVAASVAAELKAHLEMRIAQLDTEDIEVLLREIRCQVAEGAVTGTIIGSADLVERALSLVYAKTHHLDCCSTAMPSQDLSPEDERG